EAELFAGPGDVYLVSKRRPPDSHKGDFGSLLVVGGSEIYTGAPALTGMGAYSAGLDLVYVAAPETAASVIAGFSPSLITLKLKGKRVTSRNIRQLQPLLGRVDAVAVGPGLGLHEETVAAVDTFLGWVEERQLPVLVDADALKGFAQRRRRLGTPTVFTPHGGEFRILTGRRAEGDFKERGKVVQAEARRLGATILLKGSVDVVSDGVRTRYNWTGNPGMTVGGTGDVLSGVTAAFMAMGSPPFEAAVAGAFINGAAGDAAYEEKGYHLLPIDLVERIPQVMEDALVGRMRAVST
ncbi:MAG: NAD(P)H-hydrate dehydratase, partial [Candidatus Bathyarchaeia archaeon]